MKEPPDPIAVRFGANLRRLRSLAGLSQTELGRLLGVTFQQVQKYESGRNNVNVATLHRLKQILGCGLDDFFADGDEAEARGDPGRDHRRRVFMRLVRAVEAIESADLRERLILLAQAMAAKGRTTDDR